jgi:hypothetical protein
MLKDKFETKIQLKKDINPYSTNLTRNLGHKIVISL